MGSFLDATKTYYFLNGVNSGNYVLASSKSNDSLIIQAASVVDPASQWQLIPAWTNYANYPGYYFLQNAKDGGSEALDVLNNQGTSSVNLHMTGKGLYTGQMWRFDSWASDGSWRISNNFTGINMHLGVDASSGSIAMLLSGDDPSQHWSLVTDAPNALSSILPTPTSTSFSPSSFTPAMTTSVSSRSQSSQLYSATTSTIPDPSPPCSSSCRPATGTIIGAALGAFLAVALLVGVFLWLWKRGRKRRGMDHTTPELIDEDYGTHAGLEKTMATAETKPSEPLELAASSVPQTAELPTNVAPLAELPERNH